MRFLNPKHHVRELEGEENTVVLTNDPVKRKFLSAIERLEEGIAVPDAPSQQETSFLSDVVRSIGRATTHSKFQYGFLHLAKTIWPALEARWGREFGEAAVKTVMSTLIDKTVLLRHVGSDRQYYVLNSAHVIVKRLKATVG